ncbi:3-dehydroquinate dehydratase I [Tenacibaculum sp. 190130A14a]|uniref:Shikimate dehydrogenase n=1 Tax=Tenacibaculum polynesiense TaxID=3137857 RepID=A0ABM9PFU8_9FLAO
MEKKESKNIFALVGRNISYSFSRQYFNTKFEKENLENNEYINFDIEEIGELPKKIEEYKKVLKGMNVTIPYKLEVFNYLDKFDKKALRVGAVNTIKITKKGKLKGFNTDIYGFKKSLKPLLKKEHSKALILGTGGASKAVAYVLDDLNIKYKFVSRSPEGKKQITYDEISKDTLNEYKLLINCTPLGTFPNIENCPNIPYEHLTEGHLLYDLIYNPEQTTFLQKGVEKGATIKNGYEMLELQAEKAWRIWNS